MMHCMSVKTPTRDEVTAFLVGAGAALPRWVAEQLLEHRCQLPADHVGMVPADVTTMTPGVAHSESWHKCSCGVEWPVRDVEPAVQS